MIEINKLKLNSLFSLINQIVTIIIGLLLPRFILKAYGSEVNGLQASIAQFLSVINFLELGLGSVVQSALYRPIVEKNFEKINEILSAAQSFFNKLALILVVYVLFLVLFFPRIINSPLDYYSTGFLIVSMSLGLFAQFFFGITNQLFLNANQLNYIQITIQIISMVLNAILSIILIISGSSIVLVKLVSGLIFLIKPLFLNYYVNNKFNISKNQSFTSNSIPQKWNGIAQHTAYIILESTDIITLSLFSNLEDVSIYSVYNLIINGIKLMITSFTSGLQSFFGHLLAKNYINEANRYLNFVEWVIHNLVTYLFSLTMVLIIPFILIYTSGINDVNYSQPIFAGIMVVSQMSFCFRIPYISIVLAAGHYKQTQVSAIIEALINVVISIILVTKIGLVGVAIGTLMAVNYRTLYLVYYLSKNILHRELNFFLKQLICDLVIFVIIMFSHTCLNFEILNYFDWVIVALINAFVFLIISIICNLVFYRNNCIFLFNKIKNMLVR